MGLAPVSLEDMLALVRDPRWSNDRAGYGQVAHIRPHVPDRLQTLWLAVTQSVTTPYVPIPIETDPYAVPPEFVQHRYLTKYSDSTYLSADYAPQEATRYAVREFKRLLYFTSEHPMHFLNYITGAIECFEQKIMMERGELERQYLWLLQNNRYEEARQLISMNVHQHLIKSLQLGMEVTNIVESETRRLYGIRMPADTRDPGETTPPWSQEMIEETDDELVHCYDPRLDIYPRPFGVFNHYAGCR